MKGKENKKKTKWVKNDFELVSMASYSIIFLAIFAYLPMFGLILAFKDGDGVLNINNAIFRSDWVWFDNFLEFMRDKDFTNVLWNTLGLNLMSLIFTFPAPIIFALLINEIRSRKFKTAVQTVTFFPQFLSWVIYGGIVLALINMDTGVLSKIFVRLHLISAETDIIAEPKYFWAIVIFTNIFKGVGWGSVIYLAAICGLDSALYEAAELDGANRFQKMLHITLPGILPTVIVYLLLSVSGLLNNGVEQIFVFQNQLNLSASEVIDTFVLKYGIRKNMYSYATAIGFFKSVIALALILSSNLIAKKITGEGII